jgi:hypothetical protein
MQILHKVSLKKLHISQCFTDITAQYKVSYWHYCTLHSGQLCLWAQIYLRANSLFLVDNCRNKTWTEIGH